MHQCLVTTAMTFSASWYRSNTYSEKRSGIAWRVAKEKIAKWRREWIGRTRTNENAWSQEAVLLDPWEVLKVTQLKVFTDTMSTHQALKSTKYRVFQAHAAFQGTWIAGMLRHPVPSDPLRRWIPNSGERGGLGTRMSRKPKEPKVITLISKRQFPRARVAADSWSTALIQGQAKLWP